MKAQLSGEAFAGHRRRLGYHVEELAAIFKVPPQTIRRWECGLRAIPGPAIALLEVLVTQKIPYVPRRASEDSEDVHVRP